MIQSNNRGNRISTKLDQNFQNQRRELGRTNVDDIVAVSYTHLDVYKRQLHTLAEAIFGGIKVDNCLLMTNDMLNDALVNKV